MIKRYTITKEGADMLATKKQTRESKTKLRADFQVATSDEVKRAIIQSNKKHTRMMSKLSK